MWRGELFPDAPLGAALALPRGERRDGGLDLGVAAGWRHGRYRLGAELRYTIWAASIP